MNTGDFVYIDYVGRVKDTGEIFDLTKEDLAKKEGIYNPEIKYKPIPIIVDAKFILAGLNKAIKEMKVGEKRKVEIKPEEAFGERNPALVQTIPLSSFKEQKIEPKVGEIVNVAGFRGRIVSISGGRVKVDFNHPLAGKTLEYEIEIVGEIKDTKEKVEAIVFYFTGIEKEDFEVNLKEKSVEIEFKKIFNLTREVKERIANNIKEWVKLEEVRFIDVFK
ncbi:MAG: peptidylprolyl isomerase [Candidatus Aenigmatarchaeota archaeon]